ncbi:MAG: hypothetical protein IAE78_24405 [Myxococcus sp.]|nr:hypothetical protein [Myxococcus sp.]
MHEPQNAEALVDERRPRITDWFRRVNRLIRRVRQLATTPLGEYPAAGE